MDYKAKLKSHKWKRRRDEVIAKAEMRCEDCGKPTKGEAHHCGYIPRNEPWDHGDDLLMCVCRDCHKRRQAHEDAIRVSLGRLFRITNQPDLIKKGWVFMAYVANKVRRHELRKARAGK